eukprot:15062686-Alexandrium_andersonii.AAC.1
MARRPVFFRERAHLRRLTVSSALALQGCETAFTCFFCMPCLGCFRRCCWQFEVCVGHTAKPSIASIPLLSRDC